MFAKFASAQVSLVLQNDGMTDAHQVLSLDFPYYFVGSKHAELFDKSWFLKNERLASVDDVGALMRRKAQRYLVFNDNAATNVPSLATVWPPLAVPPMFTELYRDPREPHARVWRLEPAIP